MTTAHPSLRLPGALAAVATCAAFLALPAQAAPVVGAPQVNVPAAGPTRPAAPTVAAAPAAADPGPTVFPTAIDPAYKAMSTGKARMHTCLKQYKANKKAGSGNGGLHWIGKDAYWSQCSARLKPTQSAQPSTK
ncbi:hypothetical protein E3E12_07470 [Formicincola oecophyllae]|uniref:Uncharacterized protein n=1 Tax=Formicincola oecophyllae TaxID=2558361 RepID=A0A4Y6U9I5_9PROT|nr:hypothetical protein [Formicincola oecophyllae]QDH14042.1 hypothetical protein E3E12_07470 [Formicincola oecophyllae]